MSNPVLVEVTRGPRVESVHRGMVAVVDGDGGLVLSLGDIDATTFPRSACKAMQALPLVESGAADAYGFGARELALAAASHSGEPPHVALAAAMLARAGRDGTVLECGSHWSSELPVLIAQARSLDRPTALHNNCSGKHAGFVCTACHAGIDPAGYSTADHPVQQEIRGIMESLTGATLGAGDCGIDGCSIPTYAVPLRGLAHGFARMTTGVGLGPVRAAAGRRILEACMQEPFYVAGTGRACTRLMQAAPGRIFAKFGAEGVFCAAVPERGIAMALKCDDGSTRAVETMVAAVLARFFDRRSAEHAALADLADRPILSRNGIEVGRIRPAERLGA